MKVLRRRHCVEAGATAVEYALMIAFVAAVIAGAVTVLGLSLPAMYTIDF